MSFAIAVFMQSAIAADVFVEKIGGDIRLESPVTEDRRPGYLLPIKKSSSRLTFAMPAGKKVLLLERRGVDQREVPSQAIARSQRDGWVKYRVSTARPRPLDAIRVVSQHVPDGPLLVQEEYSVPEDGRRAVSEILRDRLADIERTFDVGSLHLRVSVCGDINAFVVHNWIQLCSEIVNDLHQHDQASALDFVLFHEIAHIVIDKRYPEYGHSEDMADELGFYLTAVFGDGAGLAQASEAFARFSREFGDTGGVEHFGFHEKSSIRAKRLALFSKNQDRLFKKWALKLLPAYTDASLRDLAASQIPWNELRRSAGIELQRRTSLSGR